jgi:DNA polymerase-3 subunit delta'
VKLLSNIIITQNPKEVLLELEQARTIEQFTIIDSQEQEFLVEHAQEAIAKAYVSSEITEYIILIAPRFSVIAQNRLLKILEEPPKNKEFILITSSKSSILETIKSRMPIRVLKDSKEKKNFDLDIENLSLDRVYKFVQDNSRISATECKSVVEKISLLAMKSKRYNLDASTLKIFSNSIHALEVGSPASFVLNGLLLKLLSKKIIYTG